MTATWYLGRPGDVRALGRAPARDYDRSADDAVTVQELLAGRAVQRRPLALRSFAYQWAWLETADWARLVALRTGQLGAAPYALIDAATLNLLTAEQASGSAAGYRPGYGSVSTVEQPVMLARSVAWSIPTPPPTPLVFTGTYGDSGSATQDHTFDVPAGTTGIEASLSGPDGTNFDLNLINPDGATVASSASSGSQEHLDYTGTIAAGTWTVQAWRTTGDGDYTITVTLSPGEVPEQTSVLTAPHPVWPSGYPTPAGGAWSWTSWLQSPHTVTISAVIVWRDATGASLSATTSPATALSDSWTPVTAAGTAPDGAVFADLQLRTDATDVTVHLGAGRLALGDDSTTWQPGEGLPAVSITAMAETVPIYDRRSVQLTLTEVR